MEGKRGAAACYALVSGMEGEGGRLRLPLFYCAIYCEAGAQLF